MTLKIQQVANIIEILSTFAGGVYPTYKTVDAIDDSGTKFILVPNEGGGQDSTYSIRKYKLQVRATTQALLDTAIETLEEISSNAYTSTSKYTKTSAQTSVLTAQDGINITVDNWNFNNKIAVAATQETDAPFYYNAGTHVHYGIMCRFPFNLKDDFPILTMSLTFYPASEHGATTFSDSVLIYKPSSLLASLALYDGVVLGSTSGMFDNTFGTNWTWNEETETLAGHDPPADIENSYIDPSSATLDFVIRHSNETNTMKVYNATESGKAPILTVTYDFSSSSYPYWITLKFEHDFSTNNQFYATFDVEARWAM
jgi:hypothetical protein